MPQTDTKKDGLKARIKDRIQKNTISKTEKKYITDLL